MSMQPSSPLEVPLGKYNKWCERRPLVCTDEGKIFGADKYVFDTNLSHSEKATFYVHELVGCEGLEFVVLSNAYVKQPVVLPGQIALVPCFSANLDNTDSVLDKLTLDMIHKARFVYDGWIPITDWQKASVRKALRMVDSALSVFALRASAWFSWEPKYSPMVRADIYYDFERGDVAELNRLTSVINGMGERDAVALLSSIGWLSQSIRLKEPAARFLFSILAIESLARYIEEGSAEESVFSNVRCEQLTKKQKKERRQACINDVMSELLDSDPETAVSTAYFDCVVGIKKRLQVHLTNVLPQEGEAVDLLFNAKIDGKTLYELRNEIAHGKMDTLSEAQREEVLGRAWDVERISREYILEVLKKSTGFHLSEDEISEGVSPRLSEGIVSDETMYHGPRHMAVVYSQTYGESLTLPEEPG